MLFSSKIIYLLVIINGTQDHSYSVLQNNTIHSDSEIQEIYEGASSTLLKSSNKPVEIHSRVRKFEEDLENTATDRTEGDVILFKKQKTSLYDMTTKEVKDSKNNIRPLSSILNAPFKVTCFNNNDTSDNEFTGSQEEIVPILEIDYSLASKVNTSHIRETSKPKNKSNIPHLKAFIPQPHTPSYISAYSQPSANTEPEQKFLDIFADVICEVEDKFNTFIKKHANQEYTIYDVLYSDNLEVLEKCSKEYLSQFKYIDNQTLEVISQNADLMYKFIKSLDLSLDGSLILKLISALKFNIVLNSLANQDKKILILNQIYTIFGKFLTNTESKTFLGMAPEFISFISTSHKIYSDTFELHVRGFLINLISIKRNSIIIPKLMELFDVIVKWEHVDLLIGREMCITSAFTYTFITFYSKAVKNEALKCNMRFYIVINCLSLNNKKTILHPLKESERLCMLMPYILFDLISYDVFISLETKISNKNKVFDWCWVVNGSIYPLIDDLKNIVAKFENLNSERILKNIKTDPKHYSLHKKLNNLKSKKRNLTINLLGRLNYLCFTVGIFDYNLVSALVSRINRLLY